MRLQVLRKGLVSNKFTSEKTYVDNSEIQSHAEAPFAADAVATKVMNVQ